MTDILSAPTITAPCMLCMCAAIINKMAASTYDVSAFAPLRASDVSAYAISRVVLVRVTVPVCTTVDD